MTASVPGESTEGLPARHKSPRTGRLLRHGDFERVYKLGRRHFSTSITVFYLGREAAVAAPGLRVGFTVGRALGGAVERNRMKRRLREAVRLTRPWPGAMADVVINPKKVVLTVEFNVLLNEVRQAFVVIEKKLSSRGEGQKGSRETV